MDLSKSINYKENDNNFSQNEVKLFQTTLRDYREMKPVKLIMKNFKKEKLPEKETLICCETSFQNLVFEKVIQDKICQKFPPSVTYKKMFLNQYIQILEEERVEVNEGLLSSLFEILNSGEDLNSNSNMDKKSSCYKTYQITNEGDMVTIKISTEFNLVGLTTWEAGFFLAEYILHFKHLFSNQNCIELGAGVGLTSLILNRVKPNSLIVTDFAEPILDTLSHNFSINGIENIRLDEKEKNQNLYDKPVVKISKLDWRKETEESLLPFENMDVILAADVVYDPSLAVDMIRIVKLLLNLKRENNKKRVAYLANTARNPTTFQSYLEALKNANLEYEDHSKFKFDKIFQYSRDNITLFKIYEK